MPDLDTDILTLGTAPISEAAPAGESVRYEPEFERIEGEIAKLEAVNGTPVDWGVVAAAGAEILRSKSKDLLVASFLCRGLFEVHGYPGLSAGLKIVHGLTETFWDSLFPQGKRPRARAAAAAWLAERLVNAIQRREPSAADREAIAAGLADLQGLSAQLDEKLGDQAPGFGELRRALQERLDALPAPAAPSEAPPAEAAPVAEGQAQTEAAPTTAQAPAPAPAAAPAPAPPPAPSAPAAGAPSEFSSDQDVQKGYRAGRDLLRRIAQYLRDKDPASPTPYILIRQAAWLGIEQPPPDKEGVTALREVQAGQLSALEGLVKADKHLETIEAAEAALVRTPFWLDGHRLTASALEALGHDAARRAVIDTLGGFLRRFPSLIELRFANETGFADELTRAWIQDEVLSAAESAAPSGAQAGASASAAAVGGAAPWLEAAAEAKKLATKGKISEALGLLQTGQRQATCARERFLWALEQARLCQASGRLDLAVPQLEHLDQQAAQFRLEEWEPPLSLEIAGLLLACYKARSSKEKSTPERAARIEQLQARIVRLDILSAVDSGQK